MVSAASEHRFLEAPTTPTSKLLPPQLRPRFASPCGLASSLRRARRSSPSSS